MLIGCFLFNLTPQKPQLQIKLNERNFQVDLMSQSHLGHLAMTQGSPSTLLVRTCGGGGSGGFNLTETEAAG